ncbi:hypothetical protein [Microbacterium sp. MM2322]|uniref:hypothetical protein n=1 Tax=Microbacterium sp. MM2322 TaxID=3157631 RepID=UPI0032D59311
MLVPRYLARFTAPEGWRGSIHTRTGRPFFASDVEADMLARLDEALEAGRRLGGARRVVGAPRRRDPALVLKAGALVSDLDVLVATAAETATDAAAAVLARAAASGIDVSALAARDAGTRRGRAGVPRCVSPLRRRRRRGSVAPFQVLAAGDATFETRDHGWHLGVADRLV